MNIDIILTSSVYSINKTGKYEVYEVMNHMSTSYSYTTRTEVSKPLTDTVNITLS